MIQATLDRYMVEEGTARYNRNIENARKREEESATKYGRRLLQTSIVPFADGIKGWLKGALDKKGAGKRHSAAKPIASVPADVVAFLGARSIINSIGLSKSYTTAATALGQAIEDEARFAWLKKNHPNVLKKAEKKLAHCMSSEHSRAVIVHVMNKHGLTEGRTSESSQVAEPFKTWDKATITKVGMVLLDLFKETTGLVEIILIGSGKNSSYVLQATPKTSEWIRGFNAYNEMLDPVWLPMVDVPARWSGAWGGGYTAEGLPILPLVRRASADYIKNHIDTANMPEVYEAINALQETPWAVNTKVLGVMQHLWDSRREVGSLPRSEDYELPSKPVDIATNKEAREDWRRKAHEVYTVNAALGSQRIAAAKIMNMARRFANTPRFYFPYTLDFRGRVYAVPTFLSPQGSDLSRALLRFADSEPLYTDNDAYWLAVYGANLWGNDKVSFEDRVQWVQENRAKIERVGSDPLGFQWWQEADSPFQFLAWCFEWASWLKIGPGFRTHLPVCLDGTNNGLQLLSMLTRDEVAGKATNVSPSDKPCDIYGEVANRVKDVMTSLVDGEDGEGSRLSRYWLSFGIDRKTTKRPVMVLPYGGTFFSCRDYVLAWYKDKLRAKKEDLPVFKETMARVTFLAARIWEAIDFCVERPRQAMAWFMECAKIMTDAGIPIHWTAPCGFPVVQAYKNISMFRVSTTLGDGITTQKISLAEETNILSKARQKNGISPNFVHSCDAAALVRTINLCLKMQIKNFCMIHDSYGTHAPKVHEMAAALRVAFVQLFSECVLEKARIEWQEQLLAAGSDAVLPEVPAKGSLDLSALPQSEFFFA